VAFVLEKNTTLNHQNVFKIVYQWNCKSESTLQSRFQEFNAWLKKPGDPNFVQPVSRNNYITSNHLFQNTACDSTALCLMKETKITSTDTNGSENNSLNNIWNKSLITGCW
jgi:hypothetical protein